jgi:Zn-dependent M28 family amino/carboxypeptidase
MPGTPNLAQTTNVLGLWPGSDPVLGQEVILVGAHYDHVGDDPDGLLCTAAIAGSGAEAVQTACEQVEGQRYAGANDNASGIGIMLEIARLWQETGYRPKRTILFAAWAAQEIGQVGSQHYVQDPAVPLDQTVAMLQLDAVGGGDGYYLEAQGGGDREGLLLFALATAEEWVDGRLAIKALWAEGDHVTFREVGIPTLLIAWRDASERNWPVGLADEVEPYRLGVTGRVLSLALMALAR